MGCVSIAGDFLIYFLLTKLSYEKLTKALVIFSVVRLRSVRNVCKGSLRFAGALAWQTEGWNVWNSVKGLTPRKQANWRTMYQVYDQCKKANTIVTMKHTLKIFLNAKRGN